MQIVFLPQNEKSPPDLSEGDFLLKLVAANTRETLD